MQVHVALAEQGIETGQWFQIMQPEGMRRLRLVRNMLGGGRLSCVHGFYRCKGTATQHAEDFANLLRSKEAAQRSIPNKRSPARWCKTAEMQIAADSRARERSRAEAQELTGTQRSPWKLTERAQARDTASQQLREAEERVSEVRDLANTDRRARSAKLGSRRQCGATLRQKNRSATANSDRHLVRFSRS